jgi:hypothetical protein
MVDAIIWLDSEEALYLKTTARRIRVEKKPTPCVTLAGYYFQTF